MKEEEEEKKEEEEEKKEEEEEEEEGGRRRRMEKRRRKERRKVDPVTLYWQGLCYTHCTPSAPSSGLKVFFSLKFLNSFILELLSLTAYLHHKCTVTQCKTPNSMHMYIHVYRQAG